MTLEVREVTPRGVGAVSVLRFRGSGARAAVQRMCDRPLTPRAPNVVRISLAGEAIDQAIVAVVGPDEVDVCLHGSPPIVAQILSAFEGARPSSGATLEARAAERLARAPCESAARILLDQAEGALARELEALCGRTPPERIAAIDALGARWEIARRALQPARVVLAGPVNAGKSTLFNALVGRRRTIESDEPGTTRDLVCEPAQLGAYPVLLFDTAGERELFSHSGWTSVERAGQERGRIARERADLVLWLEPAATCAPPPTASGGPPIVRLTSLADRLDAASRSSSENAISIVQDSEAARETIVRVFRRQFRLPEEPWEPGAAMPFEPELAREIDALRAVAENQAFQQRIAQILALA